MTQAARLAKPYQVPDDARTGVHIDVGVLQRPVTLHVHPVFELTTIEGSGHRQLGDSVEPYRAGELVLLAPDLPHGWTPVPNSRPQALAALFGPQTLSSLLVSGEAQVIVELLDEARYGLLFGGAVIPRIRKLLGDMLGMPPFRRRLCLLLVLDHLARDAVRRRLLSSGYRRPGSSEDFKLLCDLLEFADSRRFCHLDLAAMAARADMSQASFTRFFRRMTGQSFIDYCNGRRIERACSLLRERDGAIVEISRDLGFDNLSHFNRQFKRRVGMTPSAYRNGLEQVQA